MKSILSFATVLLMGFSTWSARADVISSVQCSDAINWDTVTTIEVTLRDFDIRPEHILLKACQPYVFVISNTGDKDHDFYSKSFFANIMLLDDDAGLVKAEFETLYVSPGLTTRVMFVPTALGEFDYKCSHLGHNLLGMSGTIEVVN